MSTAIKVELNNLIEDTIESLNDCTDEELRNMIEDIRYRKEAVDYLIRQLNDIRRNYE